MQNVAFNLQLNSAAFDTALSGVAKSLTNLQKQISQVNRNLSSITKSAQNTGSALDGASGSMRGFTATARDLTIVAGGVSLAIGGMRLAAESWIGSIIRTNAEMERLRFQLAGMSNAADPMKEARQQVEGLRDMAKQTPFALNTLSNSFVKLKATGVDPMNGSLQALADGVAAFGGDDESFKRITLAISQMSGKGVIQMEELRQQLGESMPRAVELMSRSMGVSMGELTKIISTGQLEAKRNLQTLFEEIERTYGGRSLAMMQTFSGQVSQLKTNLQTLATNEGGSGFFDQIKGLLVELNDFLSTSKADALATSLGKGLQGAVGYAVDFAQALYSVSGALRDIAYLVGGVAALNLVFTGLNSSISAVANSFATFGRVRQDMQDVGAATSLFATQLFKTGQTVDAVKMGAVGLAGALRGVGMALTAAMPLIFALGSAVILAADYFDVFGTKAQKAFEDFTKFGAETLEEARRISDERVKIVEDEVARKKRALETAERFANAPMAAQYGTTTSPEEAAKNLLDAEKKAAETRLAIEEGKKQTIERLSREENNRIERGLNERLTKQKNAYDQEMKDLGDQYNKRMEAAKEAGESQREIHDRYVKDIAASQKKLLEAELSTIDSYIKEIGSKTVGASKDQVAVYQKSIDDLNKKRQATQSRLSSINASSIAPVMLSGKGDNTEKRMEKGAKLLGTLVGDYKDLQAEIAGSSGALEKLNFELENGKYGSAKEGAEAFEEMADALRNATIAKEAFHQIDKSNDKVSSDIEHARVKLLEEQIDLQNKIAGKTEDITEAERIRMRLNNGVYKGLGSDTERFITELEATLVPITLQATALQNVGDVSRTNAFGDATANAIDNTKTKIEGLTTTVKTLRDTIAGVNFDSMGTPGQGILGNIFGGINTAMNGFRDAISGVTASANLMSKNMKVFGNPLEKGWKEQNIVGVKANNGMSVQVHREAASAFQGFINDLLATGYKINSLGGYNPRLKVNGKGLSEHAFGNAIDINPAQNPYGKNLITDMPANINELAAKWGLSWGGNWKSVKDAMHFEWTGKNGSAANSNISSADKAQIASVVAPEIAQALQPDAIIKQMRETIADVTGKIDTNLADLAKQDAKNADLRTQAADATSMRSLQNILNGLNLKEDGFSKARSTFYNQVRDGKIDPQNRDPESAQYEKQRKILDEIEAAERRIKDAKQAQADLDKAQNSATDRLASSKEKIAALEEKLKNPHAIVDDADIRRAKLLSEELKNAAEAKYGKGTEGYNQAVMQGDELVKSALRQQGLEAQIAANKEIESAQRATMTKSQLRQKEKQDALATLAAQEAAMRKAGLSEISIAETVAARKKQIDEQYGSTISKTFSDTVKSWTDMETNFSNSLDGMMGSFADGLTNLIMGTGNLSDALKGIAAQLANMAVKWAIGSVFEKKGVPTRHMGGTIGSSMGMTKSISPLAFIGAPKFHTGGVVGQKLLPSEVPIIAKKGEVVLTAAQAKAMGKNGTMTGSGFNNFNISAPVTVNASGGTKEQNSDLANQTAKAMESTMRGIVADEIRKQSRPGNSLNTRSRRR